MRFNAYFVRVRGIGLTAPTSGKLLIDGETVPSSLEPIDGGIAVLHFPHQVALSFRQELEFGRRGGVLEVLLPMLSKYNQRKLKRLATLLPTLVETPPVEWIESLLTVEKYLQASRLLSFFAADPAEWAGRLLEWEVAGRVKVISFFPPFVTSHENYCELMESLRLFLAERLARREKGVSLTEVEEHLKIPQDSLFFRYLLRSLTEELELAIMPGRLVFQRLPLSEEERVQQDQLRECLKQNRLAVFSIERAGKASTLTPAQLNQALWHLLSEGEIVSCGEHHFVLADELGRIINRLKKFKRNEGDVLTIQAFREIAGTLPRESLIVLLEHLDGQGITRRKGNHRIIELPA